MSSVFYHDLPRIVAPGILWTGGCLELSILGETVLTHFGMYLIKGSEKVFLLDTGHPIHSNEIERALDNFLGSRQIDYIMPTHPELPHCGLLPKWLTKYPSATVVGEVRDYELYYPEFQGRFQMLSPGQSLDLGDRRIVVVPGIWADLTNTYWAFETKSRMLFVSDGFSATHHHKPGTSGLLASEQPLPRLKMMQMVNELALQWTQYTDAATTFNDLDQLLEALDPRLIGPAHGAVIDRPVEMVPLIKRGMRLSVSGEEHLNATAID